VVLGALVGKKVTKGTISQTGTSMRKVGRITKENQEASAAEGNYNAIEQQLEDMKTQMQNEIDQLLKSNENIEIEKNEIRPRKSDITVEKVGILWCQR